MQKFDLIVIGGGPGGYPLAVKMARSGKKVAIIDKSSELGGTCLNWGCIPTKALLASAKGLHFLKKAETFGLGAGQISFDWQKVQQRKEKIVLQLRQGIEKLLDKSGVTRFDGFARLFPDKKIRIEGVEEELTADKIVLCVGSVPAAPAVFPQDRSIFWTSDQALNATEIPESLLVVGGGVIGLELGQVFNEFGCKVTIVEMMPQILPGLDTATAKRLLPVFKKAGLEILTGKKVEGLEPLNGNAKAIIDGKEREFSKVLIAVGRRVNHAFMQDTGLEIETENGFIKVDETYSTSLPGVYAIGDAIKGPMLAHKATYDAMTLAAQWSGQQVVADYSLVPSCVYTYPEISWVGKSEEALKSDGIEYKTGRSLFSANGKAMTAGEADGQIKTLFDQNGKLLGTIIWGPEASNIINEGTMMSQFGVDVHSFSRMIHPHPTLSEAFMESVESAFGGGVHG
ncbi:MAG: dihydrolipoamide dehydrogenase [Clostridiales bacterium]|nr:dihydrolipoamide dehydrogenase [Clostridiales bacterium]MDN5281904.1 dihydrolipoamide dehydrogenase [Candidatus Ozemobacter sp.]